MANYDLAYPGLTIDSFLDTVNELQSNGYIFKGVATPSTNPGTTTEKCAYIASEVGTYTNFGGIAVTGLSVLTYNGTAWSAASLNINLDIQQTTGQSTTAIMSQKAVTDEIQNGINIISTEDVTFELTNGYISSSTGEIVNSGSLYRYTNIIPVKEGMHIVTNAAAASSVFIIAAYSANDEVTALSAKSVPGESPVVPAVHDYIVPSGVASIRCCFRTDYVAVADFYIKIQNTINLLGEINNINEELGNIGVSENAKKVEYVNISGYITQDGVITPGGNAYYYTDIIPVNPGQVVETIVNGTTALVAAYDELGNYVKAKSFLGDNTLHVLSYKVPDGIVAIRVSYRRSDTGNFYIHIKDTIPYRDANINTYNFVSKIHGVTGRFIVPINAYNGKGWYNGQLTNISEACTYEYDVTNIEKVYVTATWKSVSGYYPLIVFFDANNQVIDTSYYNSQSIKLELIDEEIVIPENAARMYVIARNNVPSVKVVEKGGKAKKDISILFIGNSLTQDAVSYLPYLLVKSMPDINFKFYVWYCGGYTLAQHYQKFINDETCTIFSISQNGIGWCNEDNSRTMSSILSEYRFDVVCLQEYFNYKESYTSADLADFNNVISYIRDNYAYPFKVATLFHQPKRDVAESVFNLTKQGNGLILRETVADTINPAGIAIYRAMQTSLDSLGDQGHLSPDGTHAQEGLPCLLQAYVSALWVCDLLSLPYGIVNDKLRITTDIYNQINVPGANLGSGVITGTEEQHDIAQDVAVKAWKEGMKLLNSNLSDY